MTETQVLERLVPVLAKTLSVDPAKVTLDATLAEDLEADSLDNVEAVMAVEEEFGVKVDDDTAKGLKTVGDVVKLLLAQSKAA